ncbi:ribosome recycling factor [Oceanirhabdus sp. W0125-5]|uniref:ribosome recycling factor n=1 Tax=Oceanirhabdus sp. W0125-5 TaxID=2999116 RepID=UPI0022F2CDA8|nr:ribosome recycling factor [Oceanirhabdus sp. W0125-5]WBW94823.1 ribosome recycling factor [Oceanirhabdus sp. W0125-5]
MIKDIMSNMDTKMKKTIKVLNEELASMKAGRANPKMLDKIEAEYYGSMTPLSQLANISVPEPRILLITPYDKTALKEIEKAILKSDLGLNPSNDGSVIRLMVPELTEETRKNLVKSIKKHGEDSKIALRSIRHDALNKIKSLKKDNEITEDDAKDVEKDIQKEIDKFVKEIDGLISAKENDVMKV